MSRPRTARVLAIAVLSINIWATGPLDASTLGGSPFVPYEPVAINDQFMDAGVTDTSASSETGEEFRSVTGAVIARGYQCDKRAYEALQSGQESDTKEPATQISLATLTVDTRSDYVTMEKRRTPPLVTHPNGSASKPPYWFDSAHYGVYTCGWAVRDVTYTVIAKGTYKYDQTTSGGFGLADVECATGYPKGREGSEQELIPAHYLQKPADRWHPDLRGRSPEKLYGDDWQSHRFDVFDVGRAGSAKSVRDYLDLWINYDFEDRRWSPIKDTDADGCADDLDHTYQLVVTPTVTGPLHFRTYDFREYNEWDNCGLLQIKVVRGVATEAAHKFAPPAWDRCSSWAPAPYATRVSVGDGSIVVEQEARRTESLAHEEVSKIGSCATALSKSIKLPDPRACVTIPSLDLPTPTSTASTNDAEDTVPYWFYPSNQVVVGGARPAEVSEIPFPDPARTVRWDFTGKLKHTASAIRVTALRQEASGSIVSEPLGSRRLSNISLNNGGDCAELDPGDVECVKFNLGEWNDVKVTSTSESAETIESMLFDSHPNCTRTDREINARFCSATGEPFFWTPPSVRASTPEGKKTLAYKITYICKVVHVAGQNNDEEQHATSPPRTLPPPMIATLTVIPDSRFAELRDAADPTVPIPRIIVPHGSLQLPQKVSIRGTGDPGSTVTVFDRGVPIGTAVTPQNGNWSITRTFLRSGQHTVTAKMASVTGTVSAASPPSTFDVDAGIPSVSFAHTGLSNSVGEVTGSARDNLGVTKVMLKLTDALGYNEFLGVSCQPECSSTPAETKWIQNAEAYIKGKVKVQVIAFDAAGNVGQSQPLDLPLAQDAQLTAAFAPSQLTASPDPSSIRLVWLAPQVAWGDPARVDRYVVHRSEVSGKEPASGTTWTVAAPRPSLVTSSVTASVTSLDTSAVAGKRYFYQVKAIFRDGTASRPSGEATALRIDTPPETTIENPREGHRFSREVQLAGRTEPLARVHSRVTFGFSSPYAVSVTAISDRQGYWKVTVPLPLSTGESVAASAVAHAVSVTGIRGSTDTVDFLVDDSLPEVRVFSGPASGLAVAAADESITLHYGDYLHGDAMDEAGIVRVTLVYSSSDGYTKGPIEACLSCPGETVHWGHRPNYLRPGLYQVNITAYDASGNSSTIHRLLRIQSRSH